MKIHIQAKDRSFQIALPTNLIFSRFLLRLILKHISIDGRKVTGASGETIDKLSAELKQIKSRHGQWLLAEIRSADGDTVKVTL